MVMRQDKNKLGKKYVLPFFLVLALMTAISLAVPLRPTFSYSEKRELEKFPAFTLESLLSGDYFDGISLWFSDTFPGRESWLDVSQSVASLHGYSEIAIAGPLDEMEVMLPENAPEPEPPAAAPEITEPVQNTEESVASTDSMAEVTEAAGDVDEAEIDVNENYLGRAIQIGNAGFNQLSISTVMSDKYAKTISAFADRMALEGVRVISAPAPTAIGIMVDKQYLEQLRCTPQDEMLDYMHNQMSDNVLKVDTVRKLLEHNDEYVYYRTDHHWSALGAYYAYQALCEAAGFEPVALEDMEYKNQGEMIGSIYGKVPYPKRLKRDELECWIPQGSITMYRSETTFSEFPMIRDVSQGKPEGKYCAFLAADEPVVHIVNEDIPDAPNCLVIKDSFGNCYVPYLSQNYHNVYAIDYRKYWKISMAGFAKKYDIDDVIVAPYMIATQATDANDWFQVHFR